MACGYLENYRSGTPSPLFLQSIQSKGCHSKIFNNNDLTEVIMELGGVDLVKIKINGLIVGRTCWKEEVREPLLP